MERGKDQVMRPIYGDSKTIKVVINKTQNMVSDRSEVLIQLKKE